MVIHMYQLGLWGPSGKFYLSEHRAVDFDASGVPVVLGLAFIRNYLDKKERKRSLFMIICNKFGGFFNSAVRRILGV